MPYKIVLSFLFLLILSICSQVQASFKTQKFIMAIIDTGVDTSNPLLKGKIWNNQEEIPDNKIDDDKNGFIDDIYGWNFVDNNPRIRDFDGHGTHIASIIAPTASDNSLMIIKYYHQKMNPQSNLSNCLKAFRYAIDNGAKVINFSGGGYGESPEEKEILAEAFAKGILIIAAAGNDHINNDIMPYFPASYRFPNILAVGSLDSKGVVSKFSNYGDHSVQIFAEGEEILGYGVFGEKIKLSGTSQATAMVSRSIAQVAIKVDLKNHDVEEFLAKVLVTRTHEKQIDIAKLEQLKSNTESALGIRISEANSEQWIFNTN